MVQVGSGQAWGVCEIRREHVRMEAEFIGVGGAVRKKFPQDINHCHLRKRYQSKERIKAGVGYRPQLEDQGHPQARDVNTLVLIA